MDRKFDVVMQLTKALVEVHELLATRFFIQQNGSLAA